MTSRFGTPEPRHYSTPGPSVQANDEILLESEVIGRTSQLDSEKQHANFTAECNRKLLDEQLASLRGLVDEVKATSWLYEKKNDVNAKIMSIRDRHR